MSTGTKAVLETALAQIAELEEALHRERTERSIERQAAQQLITENQLHSGGTNMLTLQEVKFIRDEQFIWAIKSIRERCGLGLKESKDLCDSFKPWIEVPK